MEWIDVDYKLPPVGEYVLLSFSNFSIPLVGRYDEDEDGGGNFYIGDDTDPLIKNDPIKVECIGEGDLLRSVSFRSIRWNL